MSTWFISHNGIKVTVEDAKCVQFNAFIKSDIFTYFELKEGRGDEQDSDDLSFSISLTVVIECLNLFGGDGMATGPRLKICYGGYGHPFILLLEDQGVINDSRIRTKEAEECLDFNFASANVVSKFIMNSEYLKEVFSDLDTSSEYIQFKITPESKALEMVTCGPAGDSTITLPSDSVMVEHFSCSRTSKAKYKLQLIKHGIKPIGLSEKVSIRLDEREFLCFQFMIRTDNGPAFLEYYCSPEEELPDR